MTAVVLLAHGSPDPRSQQSVRDAASAVGARLASPVTVAFLDHDARDLSHAVADLDGERRVVVVPLLLSTAHHARVDVPAAVAALRRDVVLLDPVGHPGPVLDDLLRRCEGPAVVVAAGTRIDDERRAFAAAVAAASARTRVPAVPAYATGPGRRVADATRPGAAAVVPWLLAPGRLLDVVTASASEHGCRTVGGGLLREEEMISVLVALVAAVAADVVG